MREQQVILSWALRLDFIMTMPEELISRKIGVLPRNVEKEAEAKIKRALGVNVT